MKNCTIWTKRSCLVDYYRAYAKIDFWIFISQDILKIMLDENFKKTMHFQAIKMYKCHMANYALQFSWNVFLLLMLTYYDPHD